MIRKMAKRTRLVDYRRTDWQSVPEKADGLPIRPTFPGALIGSLVAIDPRGRPLVDFAGNAPRKCVAARNTVDLEAKDVGREVALVFEGGNPEKPIIVGLLHQPQPAQPTAAPAQASQDRPAIAAKIDGEQIVLSADKEIVLRCGDASITLTKVGKILIRGKYILSRSSGVNRIAGGSIQLN